MSEYRFVSFVPVVGEPASREVLFRYKDRRENCDPFENFQDEFYDKFCIETFEFIRPVDSESPAEPVPVTVQATPAMTVREQFALAAMQSLIRVADFRCDREISFWAVRQADNVLAELAKQQLVSTDTQLRSFDWTAERETLSARACGVIRNAINDGAVWLSDLTPEFLKAVKGGGTVMVSEIMNWKRAKESKVSE